MDSGDPERVVIVVPRKETRLHEYLCRSLASVKNVEVVLDRRAMAVTPASSNRNPSSPAFMVDVSAQPSVAT